MEKSNRKLEGKAAIITGATSGIGEATARLFAEHGARVALCGRSREKGEAIAEGITKAGGEARFFACDVASEESVAAMATQAAAAFGAIDILFNNAGTMLPSVEIERLGYGQWQETFNVNAGGCFLVSKHARPYLQQSRGVILNNASIAGMHSYATGRSYPYSASKAAVVQFSRMMAKNYGEEGIRVNCICPGVIRTPILHGRDPKIYEERIPLGRVGTPEDVAKVALFLVSDDSAYVTGAVLTVDGGASL